MELIQILLSNGWRPIGRQRARKLRRRGETVMWMYEFNTYGWKSDIRRSS